MLILIIEDEKKVDRSLTDNQTEINSTFLTITVRKG